MIQVEYKLMISSYMYYQKTLKVIPQKNMNDIHSPDREATQLGVQSTFRLYKLFRLMNDFEIAIDNSSKKI